MRLFYISEFNLPSNRANSIHVFKMLNTFAKKKIDSTLLIPFSKKNINKNNLKKFYGIKNLRYIKILSFFRSLSNFNFIYRIIFGFKISLFIKDKAQDKVIITRSIISSFFLSLFKIYHFLELHSELKGLTKLIFINFSFIRSKYIVNIIFITKELSKFYKNHVDKSLILPDGVDFERFNAFRKKIKKIKKITYTGSFYRGRGIEKIIKISKELPDLDFYVYGRRNEIFSNLPKNLKIYNFIKHSEIPKILIQSDILLMPYSKNIYLSSFKNDQDISRFTSPLKMFEYLASGTPIISSDLKVLREILVNNKNCILIKNYENINEWKKKILYLKKNKKLMAKISFNAKKTAKKYSWDYRVEKYLNEYYKFKYKKNFFPQKS